MRSEPQNLLPIHLTTLSLTAADFLLSSTTICMGAFPLQTCIQGPVVLSDAGNLNDTFTCDKMLHAEDTSYVYNGTMNGDFLFSNNTCGMEALHFERNWNSVTGETSGYLGFDRLIGTQVAECVHNTTGSRHCNQWVGATFFNQSQYCSSELSCNT
ncbi:hypothetical protein EJ03DRAFT_327907 [Teratosphaeria nubilosa]|uniref:Uncharacterized protein n=1 Tax=Teratosphaeria nubilosa TaxID=161662 RepID=A0A6G1L8Q6_9PEZI|nr:hypothetical protein EJ03DRAFT_327907 [Teratosphaeria nubilosa]